MAVLRYILGVVHILTVGALGVWVGRKRPCALAAQLCQTTDNHHYTLWEALVSSSRPFSFSPSLVAKGHSDREPTAVALYQT